MGRGDTAPRILNIDTRWKSMVSFTAWPLYPLRDKGPRTHSIGGWVGPRADLDAVV